MVEIDSELWDELGRLLKDLFSKNVPIYEDSIRSCFRTLVCSRNGYSYNDVVFEYQHPAIQGAQTDVCVLPGKDSPDYALEFKFHRKRKNTDSPKTENAGYLFGDIFRQARFRQACHETTCYVVYVTDMEMPRYFKNPANNCKMWYDLEQEGHLSLAEDHFSGIASAFLAKSGPIVPCPIQRVVKCKFDPEHMLIVDVIGSPYLAPSRQP